MKKIGIITALVAIILVGTLNAKGKKSFEILFDKNNASVILVRDESPSNAKLSSIGYERCKNRQFCLIWFFNNYEQANTGVSRAGSGNTYDPIPGLIGIYSKNKVVNKLTCYDLAGNDC